MRHLMLHRGLVLLAGFILCLHTVFPHVHAPHGAEEALVFAEKPSNERSFLDVLYDLVTADLGEEHLEHFTPADSDANLSALALSPTAPLGSYFFTAADQSIPPHQHRKQILTYHPLLPDDEMSILDRPLRGPPA